MGERASRERAVENRRHRGYNTEEGKRWGHLDIFQGWDYAISTFLRLDNRTTLRYIGILHRPKCEMHLAIECMFRVYELPPPPLPNDVLLFKPTTMSRASIERAAENGRRRSRNSACRHVRVKTDDDYINGQRGGQGGRLAHLGAESSNLESLEGQISRT